MVGLHPYSNVLTPCASGQRDRQLVNSTLNYKFMFGTLHFHITIADVWDVLLTVYSWLSLVRHHSGYGLSQWEEVLLCNTSSHWLNSYPKWSPLLTHIVVSCRTITWTGFNQDLFYVIWLKMVSMSTNEKPLSNPMTLSQEKLYQQTLIISLSSLIFIAVLLNFINLSWSTYLLTF